MSETDISPASKTSRIVIIDDPKFIHCFQSAVMAAKLSYSTRLNNPDGQAAFLIKYEYGQQLFELGMSFQSRINQL